MALGNIIKSLRDIMRQDKGVSGDAQRLEQMSWLFFLKVYDTQEETWESLDEEWESAIPEKYRWRNWAKSKDEDGKIIASVTNDAMIKLVNNMISYFKPADTSSDYEEDDDVQSQEPGKQEYVSKKTEKIQRTGDRRKDILIDVFKDVNNYMKDGGLLRQVVDVINEIDLNDADERHSFGDMYEKMLQEMQAAGAAGEFYTPRAVTKFIIDHLKPTLGERVADYACGTGGFLSSALEYLVTQKKSGKDAETYRNSVYGQEWKALPYVLCVTNLMLKDIDAPQILNIDSLTYKTIDDIKESDKADVIAMNPPYGGVSSASAKQHLQCQSSETADLFIKLITEMLADDGRAGVIIPDGFLFGDGVKKDLKELLVRKFNLHTIVRLPKSVFAPYTSIATNILFFDNKTAVGAHTGFRTKETWFYRLDMPEGYKNFSKTKYMRREHLSPADDWWEHRQEIVLDEGDIKAKCFSAEEIAADNFNLDKCKYPQEIETILPPDQLLQSYHAERERLNADIDRKLAEIQEILK
ncbi:MAG: type I restriction-modification system subunit M, partial [Bacteroidales bacterium]|nr:type I restriction-modification system subunit M [Bacteroidales bacterium]